MDPFFPQFWHPNAMVDEQPWEPRRMPSNIFWSPVTVLIDDRFGVCSLGHVERCVTHDPFWPIPSSFREAKDSMLGMNGGLQLMPWCPFPLVG